MTIKLKRKVVAVFRKTNMYKCNLFTILKKKRKKSEIEKLFVGKVLDKTDGKDLEDSKFKISYMREYKGSSTIFVFPVVFDIEEDVTHDRIKKRLKVISEFRGRVTFEI